MSDYPTINRGVITVVAKQPYCDWANEKAPYHEFDAGDETEHSAFLIRDDIDDINDTIKKYWREG